MAQQLEEQPSFATVPVQRRPMTCVGFGMIGGLVGGILGGAIGGALGGPVGSHMRGPVATIALPETNELLLGMLTGALFGALGGAILGAPGGWLIGRAGSRWTAILAMLPSALGAALIAPIESAHGGAISAVIGFLLGMSLLTLLSFILIIAVRALICWRPVRWLAACWVVLCVGGAVYTCTLPAPTFTPTDTMPTEAVVQLRCASLPPPLGIASRHCWFAAYDPAGRRWHRWEVWQTKGNDRHSWGHLRKDLMPIDAGVGGGPYEILEEWRGAEAGAILAALESAQTKYEHRDCYIAWPGPNCNTFVVWVLNEANVSSAVHPLAVGQHYDGVIGAGTTLSRAGVQVETATVGGRIGLRDGAELHLLTMPIGVDFLAPALVTPLGRCGFPR